MAGGVLFGGDIINEIRISRSLGVVGEVGSKRGVIVGPDSLLVGVRGVPDERCRMPAQTWGVAYSGNGRGENKFGGIFEEVKLREGKG